MSGRGMPRAATRWVPSSGGVPRVSCLGLGRECSVAGMASSLYELWRSSCREGVHGVGEIDRWAVREMRGRWPAEP